MYDIWSSYNLHSYSNSDEIDLNNFNFKIQKNIYFKTVLYSEHSSSNSFCIIMIEDRTIFNRSQVK